MAIRKYAGDKIVGLSSDTKPTNVADGATFYETDTLRIYVRTGGAWVAMHTPVFVANSTTPYNDTVTLGTKTVVHDASTGAVTHNLPTAVGNKATISVKKGDSSTNTVTIDANGTETIDGGTTAVLQVQYESITLVSDGSNWVII